MSYVSYQVPTWEVAQDSQTRITPGSGDVTKLIQTGSDALHVMS